MINSATDNKEIAGALCEEAYRAQRVDHSRALVVLSILGELRNPSGEDCLRRFVNLPFPTSGTRTSEGEIVEQTALATLQAKAIDGLAYLDTKSAEEEVLLQVQKHPSIIVRAEAISAYLWNHRDSPDKARSVLSRYVRKGEQIYLDRVQRDEGEKAESFNRKLEYYLKAHPEAVPPDPKFEKPQNEAPKKDQQPQIVKPPIF